MAKSTEVATAKTTAVAASGAFDYGEMAGSGFEDVTKDDLSIPFLNILQSNSPEVEEELIEGAKSGMFLNTVTKELMSGEKGFVFQPVEMTEAWVEWKPRNSGGGFVGMHDPNSELIKQVIADNGGSRIPPLGPDKKRVPFKNGENELVETYYVYGLILNEDGSEVESFAVLSFSSTKIKPFRDWKTAMYLIKGKPPIFANRARISTTRQKNDSGTYHNFKVAPMNDTWAASLIDPVAEKHLIEEGLAFKKMVAEGDASADFNHQDTKETGGGGSADTSGEDAPF